MNYREAELKIKQELTSIYGSDEAGAIAGLVIEHISGMDRSARMNRNDELSSSQMEQAAGYLKRLKNNEPVQYVLEEAWFAGMKLFVDGNVLIPRPETEELVQWVINDVREAGVPVFERNASEADATQTLKIIDIGTGSGCIALALKKAMPRAEVWGCDISEGALNVARRNGSSLNIRVDFQNADFLDAAQQKHLPSVDLVVSNPPYVPQKDKAGMHGNVVDYEPHTALFVPDNDPLVFYRALIAYSQHRLHPGASLYMEIHESLGKEVATLFSEAGFRVAIKKDMQGKERMVKAWNSSGRK
jgi:release factor glutamine methyltransferase